MKLISKLNKRFQFLLFVYDINSKYACVVPFESKKDITITTAFQNFLD